MKFPPRFTEYAKTHRQPPTVVYEMDRKNNPRAPLAPYYDWLLDQERDERREKRRG